MDRVGATSTPARTEPYHRAMARRADPERIHQARRTAVRNGLALSDEVQRLATELKDLTTAERELSEEVQGSD